MSSERCLAPQWVIQLLSFRDGGVRPLILLAIFFKFSFPCNSVTPRTSQPRLLIKEASARTPRPTCQGMTSILRRLDKKISSKPQKNANPTAEISVQAGRHLQRHLSLHQRPQFVRHAALHLVEPNEKALTRRSELHQITIACLASNDNGCPLCVEA